jgi:hypothetical protein
MFTRPGKWSPNTGLVELAVGTPHSHPLSAAPSEPLPKIGNENQEVPIDLIWLVYPSEK